MPEPRSQAWQRARTSGRSLVEVPDMAQALMDQAVQGVFRLQGRVRVFEPVREDFEALIRLVRSSLDFRYIDASVETLALALAAIAYFVSDDDAIPDYVPIIGYKDDAEVVAFVVDQVQEDLDRFLEWERKSRPIQ